MFRDNINFNSSWKKPINHYYECVDDGVDSRRAMRFAKRAFKMNKDEYVEFKRRVQSLY